MKYIHSEELLEIPEGVKVAIKTRNVVVEGPRGKLTKSLGHLAVSFTHPKQNLIKIELHHGSRKGDVKAEELERKAERKMKSWGLFSSSKYDDAAELLDRAANTYKLAKSWDKAGNCYMRLADCYLKADSKHEAASAYVDAGRCFMKNKPQEAARVLNTATTLFMEAGRLTTAAKQFKDIAEINEKDEKWEEALEFYEKAADLYDAEGQTSAANQCKLKVGQIAAQLEQYPKAIEIFESVARQSMDNNLLKYSVKGYLLNAGLCHLCRDDSMAIHNALEKYEELDPTFSNTREYKFLKDLAEAAEEVDVTKFTDVVKEFDSLTRLDSWKTTLLLRAKNHLKTLDEQEENLT